MGSRVIVSGSCAPGTNTPLAGLTDAHGALATAAVNASGEPLVEMRIVWAAGGIGGAAKESVAALNVKVGKGADTFSVTVTLTGVPTPATVTVIVARYWPTDKLVGFARALRVAGTFPVSGVTVNHNVLVPLIATV